MRKVIVNSTSLIALCHVNKLELLRDLYGEITTPEASVLKAGRGRIVLIGSSTIDNICLSLKGVIKWMH